MQRLETPAQFNRAHQQMVALLPLRAFVLVAAADGAIDRREIRQGLRGLEELADTTVVGAAALEHLQTAPFGEVLEELASETPAAHGAALMVVGAVLDEALGARAVQEKRAVVRYARSVAEASGGWFGFGAKADDSQEAVLGMISVALRVPGLQVHD